MIQIGSRTRAQPPPPAIVFAALVEPEASTGRRPWLFLLPDEQVPTVLERRPISSVTWSSLWPARPDAVVRFDLRPGHGGTDLGWTLSVDEPAPDAALTGHLRRRLNELINRDLRDAFGQ